MKIPAQNLGKVVSIRGSVVDVHFDTHLPPIYSLLRTGQAAEIALEVLSQLDAQPVRKIGSDSISNYFPLC